MRVEGERDGEKRGKKSNISLNESLLGVSVSQVDGVGVLPQALHPSSLSPPPPPPSARVCVCVCLQRGRGFGLVGAGMTGKH